MIKFFILIISLFSTVSSFAQKGDTVSIQQNVLERAALKPHLVEPCFINPSLIYYQYDSSLSTLSIEGKLEHLYNATDAEEGNGWNGFNVGAASYIRLTDNSTVWGKAYYENGQRNNVHWNESSDFDIVYPYVAADTVGGDMRSNTYYFNGGYAQRYKNWTFGGEFSYRALMEYRDVDPRPKNTIADLRGKIGLSYQLFSKYAIGLSADAQKYKQNGNIKYFNELGVYKTYHLQGLGISFVRFDGTNTSVNYQGNQWGVTANLLPTSRHGGFMANVAFHKDFKEKILPFSNSLTLNDLKETQWNVDVGWLSTNQARNQFGVKGSIALKDRNGCEFYYGDPTGNIYPVIAIKENFHRNLASYQVTGFYQRHHNALWTFGGDLSIGYDTRQESHKESKNSMDCNVINARIDFHSIWKWKKQLVMLHAACEYQNCTDAQLIIKRTTNNYAEQILNHNFGFYNTDKVGYKVAARWCSVVKNNKMIYLEATWAQRHYLDCDKGYCAMADLGFTF